MFVHPELADVFAGLPPRPENPAPSGVAKEEMREPG